MLLVEEIFKAQKNQYNEHFNLRFQRSLSWFKGAMDLESSSEVKFIHLCLAFKALYAEYETSVSSTWQSFMQELCRYDQEQRIKHLLWHRYDDHIRQIFEIMALSADFCDYKHQKISEAEFKMAHAHEKHQLQQALFEHNTQSLLDLLLTRIQNLQQQVFTGGMSFQSVVAKKWLSVCSQVLSGLMPICLQLILEYPQSLSDKAYYPVQHLHA